jgi:hypothetical protein
MKQLDQIYINGEFVTPHGTRTHEYPFYLSLSSPEMLRWAGPVGAPVTADRPDAAVRPTSG